LVRVLTCLDAEGAGELAPAADNNPQALIKTTTPHALSEFATPRDFMSSIPLQMSAPGLPC
jgi:hypothetical protein